LTKSQEKAVFLKAEILRKSLHLLIALVPFLASLDLSHTVLLLMGGVFFYFSAESLRFLGFSLPLISGITQAAIRKRETGCFALGPVTLGLGALLALLLFPPQAAAAAIYAMAFGDSASTLIGRVLGRLRPAFLLGRLRPAFLFGKSVEGIFACFAAAAMCGYLVFGDLKPALAIGFVSLIVDIFPLKDFDNLLMPLAAGLAAMVFS